jgi:hypothetical protein
VITLTFTTVQAVQYLVHWYTWYTGTPGTGTRTRTVYHTIRSVYYSIFQTILYSGIKFTFIKIQQY